MNNHTLQFVLAFQVGSVGFDVFAEIDFFVKLQSSMDFLMLEAGQIEDYSLKVYN